MCERGTKNERGILIRRCLSTFVGWHRSPREMSRNRMCVNDHFRPREIQRFTRFRVWLNTKDLLTGTLGGQFPCKIEQVPILTHKTGIGSNAADATWNKSQRQHEILTPSHDHHNKNQKSVEHRFCWFFWVQRCLRCTNFLCTYKREMMVRCCFCFV